VNGYTHGVWTCVSISFVQVDVMVIAGWVIMVFIYILICV
jgi:hypothetical protein